MALLYLIIEMLNRKSSNFDKKLNCDKNYCDFAYLKKNLKHVQGGFKS